MKTKTIFLLLIINFLFNIKAQTLSLPQNIQSPNASSLGKYGDIPMDLSTGRAQISIPIFNLNESNIPLEISLSYDTGGVRVNDVPGWVGQNWTLNAGGIITRVVRGSSFDERYPNDIAQGATNWGWNNGYYYNTQVLNNSNWNSFDYMKNAIRDAGLTNLEQPSKDLQPDIFIFNFMGYTGKFFLGSDGVWKVSSKSNLKVEINIKDKVIPMEFPSTNNYNQRSFLKVLSKITIIDYKGNKYVFGGQQNKIEYTIPDFFNQLRNPIVANAWYLSEVYNKNGDKVYSFEYERGDYIANFYNVNNAKSFSKENDAVFFVRPGVGCEGGTTMGNRVIAAGQLIIPTYLKSIKTKSLKEIVFSSSINNALKYKYQSGDTPIDNTFFDVNASYQGRADASSIEDGLFYYIKRLQNGVTANANVSSGVFSSYINALKWRKLDAITIKDEKQSFIKQVSLTYNNNSNERLKLENVLIDNQFKYLFSYNKLELLPKFTSLNVDHNGYYKLSPFVLDYNNPSIHEASRDTDPNTVSYGTLNYIRYPLGGYTVFQYEPHSYSKIVDPECINVGCSLLNTSGKIGGVRVGKIIDVNEDLNKTVKEYLYTKNYNSSISSGILIQKNVYYKKNFLIPTENNVPYYQTEFNISSIIHLSNLFGPQIEYSTVIEKQNGNGYIINNFSTYEDYPNIPNSGKLGQDNSFFEPHNEYNYKRNILKSKQFFDNDNNILREDYYNYSELSPKSVRGLSFKFFPVCPVMSQQTQEYVIAGNAYEIFFSDFNLSSKKSRIYGKNGIYQEQVEEFKYQDIGTFGDNFLKSNSKVNTEGNTLVDTYTYSFDKINSEPYATMANRREFAIVETLKTSNQNVLGKTKVEYSNVPVINDNGTNTTQIYPQKYSEGKGNNLEEELVIDRYDNNANILKAHKKDGNFIYYFYGYKNLYPIVKIEGVEIANESALQTQINTLKSILDNSGSFSQIHTQQKSILNSLPNHQVTFYTYDSRFGVLTSVMQGNGLVEYYNYDSFGRLLNIKDKDNILVKQIDYQISSATQKLLFLNNPKEQSFTRNNCGSDYIGSSVPYVVPRGKYFSYLSEADADQQAQNEININGQNNANTYGTCTAFNCSIVRYISGVNYSYISPVNNYLRVQYSFSSGYGMPWTTSGVVIGNITGTCRPSIIKTTSTYSSGVWSITINPNGDILAKMVSVGSGGATLADGITINLDFNYSIN